MALDKATVARIATLARIKVPADEQDHLAGELSQILTWIEQLREVPTEGVEPMASVSEVSLPMREDVVADGAIPEKILSQAPEAAHGFFVVPKVVE